MKITLIQTNIFWAEKARNLRFLQEKLAKIANSTDLVILPEMFSTGFCVEKVDLAEEMSGETVRNLKLWAKEFNFAIAGSFFATENGKFYNRAFFVLPDGEIQTADKRHIFSLAKENETITAGDKRLIINYKDVNICVLVCYDIRFPVWARNAGNEYDLLLYVANFPDKRIDVWNTLLPARAIENQAFVCGVNRIGTDGNDFAHSGHSALFDYKGEKILSFDENEENEKSFEINIENIKYFREKYSFWKDADKFNFSVPLFFGHQV
jgi:predicted amidohydrolase